MCILALLKMQPVKITVTGPKVFAYQIRLVITEIFRCDYEG